jgi:hypothetical protein
MNNLTASAWNRVGRTILQFLLSAGFVELVLQQLAGLDLDPQAQLAVTGLVQAGVAFLHRRLLDPSPVPSLVDGNASAVSAHEV